MKAIVSLIALSLCLTGCASKVEKSEVINQTEKSSVKDQNALKETIEETIRTSEHLSADQKALLEKILAENKLQADKLQEESYKTRSVLIKELLSPEQNRKKISFLKRNIQRIEKNKLENTFQAVEKISDVVSKTPDREKFTTPLQNLDRSF